MKSRPSFVALCSFLTLAHVCAADAVDFPRASNPGTGVPMGQQFNSSYGQIQNVQNYSSNPFFDPNGPYNQRMPVPIYVQGTDITTAECQALMNALVAQQCAVMKTCETKSVSDLRPAIMVQLSNLGGKNYTSCAGYLDGALAEYKTRNSGLNINGPTAFPTPFPGAVGSNAPREAWEMGNPGEKNPEPWRKALIGRIVEMDNLAAENGNNAAEVKIAAANMPQTIHNLSFAERMNIEKAGLMPWKDKSAYQQLNLSNLEERDAYFTRLDKEVVAEGKYQKAIVTAEKDLLAEKTQRDKTKIQNQYAGKIEDLGQQKNVLGAESSLNKATGDKFDSDKELLKRTDPCGWCDKNQDVCKAEVHQLLDGKPGNKTSGLNSIEIENACQSRRDKAQLWHVENICDDGIYKQTINAKDEDKKFFINKPGYTSMPDKCKDKDTGNLRVCFEQWPDFEGDKLVMITDVNCRALADQKAKDRQHELNMERAKNATAAEEARRQREEEEGRRKREPKVITKEECENKTGYHWDEDKEECMKDEEDETLKTCEDLHAELDDALNQSDITMGGNAYSDFDKVCIDVSRSISGKQCTSSDNINFESTLALTVYNGDNKKYYCIICNVKYAKVTDATDTYKISNVYRRRQGNTHFRNETCPGYKQYSQYNYSSSRSSRSGPYSGSQDPNAVKKNEEMKKNFDDLINKPQAGGKIS